MKEIELTRGLVALIDDGDYDWINQWKWCADAKGYAVRRAGKNEGKQTAVKMHRQIIGLVQGDGIICDHVNHNTLDNRRENLRSCSKAQNGHNRKINKDNTSGFKGVCWHKHRKMWASAIMLNGKSKCLGYFDDPALAHDAYCKAASEHHGDFANFGNE